MYLISFGVECSREVNLNIHILIIIIVLVCMFSLTVWTIAVTHLMSHSVKQDLSNIILP